MSIPAIAPIKIIKGDTFRHTFLWKNPDGSAVILTGYTAKMQIRNYRGAGSTVIVNVTDITITDGRFDIVIDEALTALLTSGRAVYDFVVVDGNGKDETLARGAVIILERATA